MDTAQVIEAAPLVAMQMDPHSALAAMMILLALAAAAIGLALDAGEGAGKKR